MGYIYCSSNGGGIVNRLNCIFNAIVFQEILGRKIIVHWNDRHDSCHCSLTEVFTQTETNLLEIYEDVTFPTENYHLMVDWENDAHLAREANSVNFRHFNAETFREFLISTPDNIDFIIRTPNVYNFNVPMHYILEKFHTLLKFNDTFKDFIRGFLEREQFQVGLHIRLTEKIIVNNYNMDRFISELHTIKQHYNGVRLLVCSDDKDIEQLAVDTIGNCTHFVKNAKLEKKIEGKPFISWDDKEMNGYFENIIRNKEYSLDGFKDLYLLGCCEKIIGINTDGSTYTNFAKLLTQINIKSHFST